MHSEKNTYRVILLVSILLFVLVTIYIINLQNILEIPECIIYKTFGIYCPRMWKHKSCI